MKYLFLICSLWMTTLGFAARGRIEVVTQTMNFFGDSTKNPTFAIAHRLVVIGDSQADCTTTYNEYQQKLELTNKIVTQAIPCALFQRQYDNDDGKWVGSF